MKKYGLIGLLLCFALPAQATCSLSEHLIYQDKHLIVSPETHFPRTPQYDNWVANLSGCSADNQGRPIYQIFDNEIFLVNFNSCAAGQVDLRKIYPDLLAEQSSVSAKSPTVWQKIVAFWRELFAPNTTQSPAPNLSAKKKATWLTGELSAYGGESACMSGYCSIPSDEYTFSVQNGMVTAVRKGKNPFVAKYCSQN